MRKIVFIFSFLLVNSVVLSQKKTTTKKAKDTLKTEVINVITSYSPTISDAFKIKKNPAVNLTKAQKKKLQYTIFSIPVASTFVPRIGTFKGVNTGEKERIYKNYLAAGFGNNTTPFFEMFLSHTTRSKTNFGLYGKYISSENPVKNTPLDSGFSNAIIGAFYKQEERDFNWTAGADFRRNQYNWYGLPDDVSSMKNIISSINEKQIYTDFNAKGEVIFDNSYLKYGGNIDFSYFSDKLNSEEFRLSIKPQFQLLFGDSDIKLNDISIDGSVEYLGGKFTKTYNNNATLKHSFFTLGASPKYNLGNKYFNMKLGTKLYFTSDIENKISQFFIYPDINVTFAILENYVNFYIGANGDLKTNSYEDFVSENPYLSPTQFITQTNKKYNFFVGLTGKLSFNIDYHFKASYSDEDDKALFIRNNSKFDRSNSDSLLLGYEFGNSFSVVYDDVKTLSLSGKLTIDLSKNLIIGAAGEFNSFKLTNQTEAWNLPNITAEIFGNYKIDKWYAGTNLFFVGERKGLADGSVFPPTRGTQTLKYYVDLNLNGGYYFNDKFTAFLKFNNILNSDYQRYSNFTVQGFQVLGGISYKFDF